MMLQTLIACYILSAIIGLLCLPFVKVKAVQVLALYWAVSVAIDLTIERFDDGDGRVIRGFYCIYYVWSIFVYTYVLGEKLSLKNSQFWLLGLANLAVLLTAGWEFFFNLSEVTAANTVFIVEAFATLVVTLSFYGNFFLARSVATPFKNPLFLVATALLLYTAGNLIATGFFHQIFQYSKALAHSLYQLNYGMNILMSILFAIAFILSTRPNMQYSNEY